MADVNGGPELPPDPFELPEGARVGPMFETCRLELFDYAGAKYVRLVFHSRHGMIVHHFSEEQFGEFLESGAVFLDAARGGVSVLESPEVIEEMRRRGEIG